jgi:hypothetical protein
MLVGWLACFLLLSSSLSLSLSLSFPVPKGVSAEEEDREKKPLSALLAMAAKDVCTDLESGAPD